MMRSLFIALLIMMTASSAHAVTFLDGIQGYDFGEVPEGEMREELLVFDLSDENFIRSLDPLQWIGARVPVRVDRFESFTLMSLGDGVHDFGTDRPIDPSAPVGIHLSVVDCGAFGGYPTVCINAKFTSVLNNPFGSSNFAYWENRWNTVGEFEDGSRAIFAGNSFITYRSVRYTPVPVPLPATLPFMIGGLGLLALLLRRRQG